MPSYARSARHADIAEVQRTAIIIVVALVAILHLPGMSGAQISCRANIFDGQDCTGPGGESSSHPNIFGATTRPSLTAHGHHPIRTSSVVRTRRHPRAPSSPGRTSSAERTIACRAATSSRTRTSSAVRTSGSPTAMSWSAVRTSSAARIAANEAPVFEPAADLVNPLHCRAVAPEQQDGAVLDDDLHVALVVLDP